MKTCHQSLHKWAGRTVHEAGMASILFMALLALMVVFVSFEACSIGRLAQEERILEHQQIKRLAATPTNAVASVTQP